MSDSEILNHLTYLGSGKGYQCKLCQKLLGTKPTSKRHVQKVHLQPQEFVCEIPSCAKVFKTQAGLAGHVKNHSKLPYTKCPHPSCPTSTDQIKK